jgi:hypothetical protein
VPCKSRRYEAVVAPGSAMRGTATPLNMQSRTNRRLTAGEQPQILSVGEQSSRQRFCTVSRRSVSWRPSPALSLSWREVGQRSGRGHINVGTLPSTLFVCSARGTWYLACLPWTPAHLSSGDLRYSRNGVPSSLFSSCPQLLGPDFRVRLAGLCVRLCLG